jgi:3-oxoisoapionate kinase
MSATPELLLAYYGDDFTGSTDALESLSRVGVRTALFLSPPTPAQLARHPGLEAIGVAGLSRSLSPAAMTEELRPAFTALRALGPRHVHYKVCSTFDSSPVIGSIGRAIEIGAEVFGNRYVPLLVGAPALGRYCVFGNLFARMGIGSTGEIYRLDRHPSMSRHPVTPAHESDLCLHLARQTKKPIALFDILKAALPEDEARAALDKIVSGGAEIILFDLLSSDQMARLGSLIDHEAAQRTPLFSVGSSGVGAALGAYWTAEARVKPINSWSNHGTAEPLLVVSGSCSPVTAGQIAWAQANGFATIALDPVSPDISGTVAKATAELKTGRHTVVYTSRGEPDAPVPASVLGTALGKIALGTVEQAGTRRLLVAGGDTSSYAGRALGIESVEMIAPLAPGAPLCRAYASNSAVNGLEINFKGGQVGAPDYFGAVVQGSLSSSD